MNLVFLITEIVFIWTIILGNVVGFKRIEILTTHGTVSGFQINSHYGELMDRKINIFLGIPYAKRPSQFTDWRRYFRFRKPERPLWSGIWDASYYRPACPQHLWYIKQTVPGIEKQNVSEDCLYANVFMPVNAKERPSNSPSLYPVMVFIHGGGYTLGSSHQYPGIFLTERQVVVVTFNYRLGPLGFLSTNDKNSPGNYGMFDQVRLLEWVQQNIENFRGNPRLVTIFGQSTGAASVGLHILSPRSEKLFVRAIMQSGSDRSEWSYIKPAHAQQYAKDLAWELGCPTNDNYRLVQCMQLYRTADEIVNASAKVWTRNGEVGNPWGPTVDGPISGVNYAFLNEKPKTMREQASFKKIKVMAGLNKDEGSFFIPNLKTLEEGISPDEFNNIGTEFLNNKKSLDMTNTLDALKFQYTYWPQPKNYTFVRQMAVDMMSDYMFGTGMDEVVKAHAQYNKTYVYVFKYASWNDYLPYWRGVAHGQELQYVFGFPYFNQTYKDITGLYPRQRYDYADRNISEYMITLWTNFSSNGAPTDRTAGLKNFRNITWLEYNLYNHSYLCIANVSVNRVNFRQSEYGFWRTYFPQLWVRPYYYTTAKTQEAGKPEFQTATWSLTALAIILIFIVIALIIVVRRMRPKDY